MGSAKDKHGVRERFAKEFVYSQRMAVCRKRNLGQPPYIYIYIIYTYIQVIQTYTQTDRQTDGPTDRHKYIHAGRHACIHPSVHPSIHPCMHTDVYIHTYVYTTILYTYVHTHTCVAIPGDFTGSETKKNDPNFHGSRLLMILVPSCAQSLEVHVASSGISSTSPKQPGPVKGQRQGQGQGQGQRQRKEQRGRRRRRKGDSAKTIVFNRI